MEIKIAICDDEEVIRKKLKMIVERYVLKKGIFVTTEEFSSGEDFLTSNNEYEIIFLDISMRGMDGIQVGKAIRERDKEVVIIYVTAFLDFSLEGYKVNAFRYLLKNEKSIEADMHECLEAVLEHLNKKTEFQTFAFREGKKKLELNSIVYVESRLHTLEFHLIGNNKEEKIYTINEVLNHMERQLQSKYFLRVHQSYMVNMNYIRKIQQDKIILKTQKEIPVSRSKKKTVCEKFAAYKGEI